MSNNQDIPVISTTLLNWNRADLLRATLESYLATIKIPFELFIIDNASEDNSREVIESYCKNYKQVNAIFLQENVGGEAINIGLRQSRGKLLHVSENDIKYLSGWSKKIIELFDGFKDLGQLSLFGPVPTDNEIWEVKPSSLCHSKGNIVYKTTANIGTSSVFSKEIWDKGIRFKSINKSGKFIFPDDAKFSEDIKDLGYMVAWAPHYLVENMGHLAKEFNTREKYYLENYRSKPWLGEAGLQKRINLWNKMPKPARDSIIVPNKKISAEKSLPSSECPLPQLWSMFDGWTAEVETIEFLYAFIRLIKPALAIETGTWHGYAAEAIGKAMHRNGFGKLISLEIDHESFQTAKNRITENGLENIVTLLNQSSLSYTPHKKIDFILLDSALEIRFEEFFHFQNFLKNDAYVVFHDTSKQHKIVRKGIKKLRDKGLIQGLTFPTPRGLSLFQYKGSRKLDKNVKSENKSTENREINTFPKRVNSFSNSNSSISELRDLEPIYIAGMHRSGTSMVTRILNLCGMKLGDDEKIMEEHPTNAKGFWEHLDFVSINEAILAAINGSWETVPDFNSGWYKSDKLKTFRSQAHNLIKKFENISIWGWKDPRNSLTIEFWKSLLPDMKVVICLRHPLEVARSLQRRDNFSIKKGLKLWVLYNKILFSNTNPKNRIVTHYNKYFNSPEKEIKRLLTRLDITSEEAEIENAISTISTKMWHNKHTVENFLNLKAYPQLFSYYKKLCSEADYYPDSQFNNHSSKQNSNNQNLATLTSHDSTKNEPPSENITVSIVMPVYNNLHYTKQCVNSILENTIYSSYEIIIINNASSDGTHEYLKEIEQKYEHIRAINNQQNQGFAKASNQGAKAATGDFILFLNNDTKVLSGWLDPLVKILENDSSVAAVGSKLLFPDKTIQHAGVIIVENRKEGVPLIARHIYYKKPAYFKEANQLRTYQALTAACLLVKNDEFKAAGRFDENFWNGYEDVDLCFRMKQRGKKLVYQPRSVVIHYESQSGPERFSKINQNVDRLQSRWLDKIKPDAIINKEDEINLTKDHNIKKYNPPIKNSADSTSHNNSPSPFVSIIMLTYNALEYTKQSIKSIRQNTTLPYEIIFVDNNSSDGTQQFLQETIKDNSNFSLIQNENNRGFAAANNQGMQKARGQYILLLNNDVLVAEGWLQRLTKCARADQKIGLVGPLTNRISGTQMVDNVPYNDPQDFPKYAHKIADSYPYKYIPRRRIAGFAMLVKRKLYEEIGGLDERFGSGNYEDDDYCIRASQAGYKIYVAEDTYIHHFGSRTFVTNNISYDENLKENENIFNKKWPHVDLNWLHEKDEMLFSINDELNRKGFNYLNQNKYKQSKNIFIEVLEKDPINTDALFGLSLCAQASNNGLRAIEILKKLLKINPKYHYAYNMLGKISFENGNLERAYNLFRKACNLEPNFINAKRNIGIVLSKMEKNREAIEVFKSILNQFHDDSKTIQQLIQINSKLDNPHEAKKYAKMLLRKQPNNTEAQGVLRAT